MKDLKVTKGEWTVEKRDARNIISVDDRGGFIDVWGNDIAGVSDEEKEANTKLIMASVEMFEMLKVIYLSFGGGNIITFSEKDIEDMEQLLTKITQ